MSEKSASRTERGRDIWLPLVFLGFSIAVLVALWWWLDTNEARQIRISTEITAEQVELRLEAWITTRVDLVEYVARTYAAHPREEPFVFRELAQRYVDLAPGFQALNLVDPDWVIRTTVPELGNERALNQLARSIHRGW